MPNANHVSLLQDSLDQSAPSSPAVGHRESSSSVRPSSPQQRTPERNTEAVDDAPVPSGVKNASEISLGSPVPKSAAKARGQQKPVPLATSEKKAVSSNQKNAPAQLGVNGSTTKPKPIKLNLAMVSSPAQEDATKGDAAGQSASTQAPASTLGSRPNTPMTGVSRASDSPAPRQPRVLRVVDTPKSEVPPPTPASQTVSAVPASKIRSRRPSISSMSRPDTPGDLASEGDLYTSASVSRANSPPPSRIGSAPVRAVTKSQAKKERRQKAKEAEAAVQVAAAQVEEPVQAPIVGRKRKTKKGPTSNDEEAASPAKEHAPEVNKQAQSASEADEAPAVKPEASKPAVDPPKPAKEQPTPPPPATKKKERPKPKSERWKDRNTIHQLIIDVDTPKNLGDLFLQRTAPLHALFAQLHKAGIVDANEHPFFNPQNLSQRSDLKCTSDDYDALKRPIELTEEHRRALLRVEAVRPNPDAKSLKERCLITPRGAVLRHLTLEEEERYLTLEKTVGWGVDAFPNWPEKSMLEPDLSNRDGDIDALFATPERFNICWVDDEASSKLAAASSEAVDINAQYVSSAPPNVLSAMEADSTRSHNWAVANTAEMIKTSAASVRSFAAATAKHMLGAAGVAAGAIPDLEDIVAMTDDELRAFAAKSQKELEVSRKEFDAIDKKMAALFKRNKKVAQQALATTVEG